MVAIHVKTPVYVDQMPGDTFDDRLVTAVYTARAIARGRPGQVVLPGRGRISYRTFTGAHGPTPHHPDQLLNGVTIIGNNTSIIWAGPESTAIWSLLSPSGVRVEGELTLDARETPGVIPFRIETAWPYNRNGAINNVFSGITATGGRDGFYIGDPMGPDHRLNRFENCTARNVDRGWVIEGANIAGLVLDGCQAMDYRHGVAAIGRTSLVFELDQVTDPWGQPYRFDQYSTAVWLQRQFIRGDQHRTKGGAPNVTIRDFIGHNKRGRSVTFVSDGAAMAINNARIEGKQNDAFYGFGPGGGRFRSRLVNVSTAFGGLRYDGGPPLTVVDGYYPRGITGRQASRVTRIGDIYTGGRGQNNEGTAAGPNRPTQPPDR